jgi:hypothetical protein
MENGKLDHNRVLISFYHLFRRAFASDSSETLKCSARARLQNICMQSEPERSAQTKSWTMIFYFPGDVFGIEAGITHQFSTDAIIDSDIVLVKRPTADAMGTHDQQFAYTL